MAARIFRLTLAYDGSAYHGWQRQPQVPTLQAALETALARSLGCTVNVAASGRTDAGVHALAQVVSFRMEHSIPVAKLLLALRNVLPADIAAISLEEAPSTFHARMSACWKCYRYRIVENEQHDPFLARYAWQMRSRLSEKALAEAAALLIGEHDFSAFRSSGSIETSPVRTIYSAAWRRQGNELEFTIAGDGFLYHMVRNLVWSMVQLGLGLRSLKDFAAELEAARCEFSNAPAPAAGLYLVQVGYAPWPQA